MQAMSDNLYANKHVACRTRNDADRYGAVRHSALRGSAARCVERRRSGLRGKELRGNAARGSELRGNGALPLFATFCLSWRPAVNEIGLFSVASNIGVTLISGFGVFQGH